MNTDPHASLQQVTTATMVESKTSRGSRREQDAVSRISANLEQRIGSHRYRMWFAHGNLHINGERLEVAADSQYVADWIGSHFADDLRHAAREATGAAIQLDVRVADRIEGDSIDGSANPRPDRRHEARSEAASGHHATHGPRHHRQEQGHRDGSGASVRRPDGSPARSRPRLHRLEDFVVGTCNRMAYAAACRLVDEADGRVSPLFIHGECGVGKTHLVQGVCQRFIDLTGQPQLVRYVTGEQFTNEYIASIRNNEIDSFRQRIRKLDLLAIDDVHFLASKARTQGEFLHTLESIDLRGARVVLASDNHPHHIRSFNQSLVSRFLSGMVVQLERPDILTRTALIQRLAAARGLRINPAAMQAIAERSSGSVRELEGLLTKVAAYWALLRSDQPADAAEEIGMVLIDQLFKEERALPAQKVRLATVIDSVCAQLSLGRADLTGNGRHRRIVLARSLVAYLSRELTTHSFPEIAQALGRSNHSTVHTADARLRRQIGENAAIDMGGEGEIVLRELADTIRRTILRAAK